MFYFATFWIWQDTWNQTFLFHQRGVRFHSRGWKNQARSKLWFHGHGKLLWHNVAANQSTTKYCKIQLSPQLDLKIDSKSKVSREFLHSYDFRTLFPPLNNLCTFSKLTYFEIHIWKMYLNWLKYFNLMNCPTCLEL